jgi:hypothetical protein
VLLPDNISHPTATQTFEHDQSLAHTLKKVVQSGEIHTGDSYKGIKIHQNTAFKCVPS